jgi:sugar transferase (PEP-CTERM/EpsH1 system associated)
MEQAVMPPEAITGSAESAERPPLLFLCHRIPYPPNKGDKIRAFHLLRHLARHFRIHLATFVDDPADWSYTGDVDALCETTDFAPLSPTRARMRSISALATGEPLTLPYYRDRGLAKRVASIVARHEIDHAVVYSAAMAQYLPEGAVFHRRVLDFVDVDSNKWLQYSARKPWPWSWVYRRESHRLLSYERTLAERFDAGLFVSSAEADLFRSLAPEVACRIGHYDNGVDSTYFSPGRNYERPFPADARVLVFTGAMDYWPNVDAVCWFADEVFPALRKVDSRLAFYIVGTNPAPQVQALAKREGIHVTGRVPDVRPYLEHALAAVAPMRVARGVQNKVLEAMAMARPVLLTARGLEGIGACDGEHVLLGETADDYARHLKGLLGERYGNIGERARALVRRRFAWDSCLPEVVALLAGTPATSVGVAHG